MRSISVKQEKRKRKQISIWLEAEQKQVIFCLTIFDSVFRLKITAEQIINEMSQIPSAISTGSIF